MPVVGVGLLNCEVDPIPDFLGNIHQERVEVRLLKFCAWEDEASLVGFEVSHHDWLGVDLIDISLPRRQEGLLR